MRLYRISSEEYSDKMNEKQNKTKIMYVLLLFLAIFSVSMSEQIVLVSPSQNTVFTSNNVTIAFYTDTNFTTCDLYINNELNHTFSNIIENVQYNFTQNYDEGIYKYYIQCEDITSEIRSFGVIQQQTFDNFVVDFINVYGVFIYMFFAFGMVTILISQMSTRLFIYSVILILLFLVFNETFLMYIAILSLVLAFVAKQLGL